MWDCQSISRLDPTPTLIGNAKAFRSGPICPEHPGAHVIRHGRRLLDVNDRRG